MSDSETAEFGNKQITFTWSRGTVAQHRDWERVNIHSSAPDVYGNVSISSTVTDHHEIWLVKPDGTEFSFTACKFPMSYHAGHVIDFLTAKCGKKNYLLRVSNRSMGRYVYYDDNLRSLIHTCGWGWARVLGVGVFGVWAFPAWIHKQADKIQAQPGQDMESTDLKAMETYYAGIHAAGNDAASRRQANSRYHARLEANRSAVERVENSAKNMRGLVDSSAYWGTIWVFLLTVFIHAWFRHRRPRFFSAIKKYVSELDSRRGAEQGLPTFRLGTNTTG